MFIMGLLGLWLCELWGVVTRFQVCVLWLIVIGLVCCLFWGFGVFCCFGLGCFGFVVWGGCSCRIVVGWFAALCGLMWRNVLRFRLV